MLLGCAASAGLGAANPFDEDDLAAAEELGPGSGAPGPSSTNPVRSWTSPLSSPMRTARYSGSVKKALGES